MRVEWVDMVHVRVEGGTCEGGGWRCERGDTG